MGHIFQFGLTSTFPSGRQIYWANQIIRIFFGEHEIRTIDISYVIPMYLTYLSHNWYLFAGLSKNYRHPLTFPPSTTLFFISCDRLWDSVSASVAELFSFFKKKKKFVLSSIKFPRLSSGEWTLNFETREASMGRWHAIFCILVWILGGPFTLLHKKLFIIPEEILECRKVAPKQTPGIELKCNVNLVY